MKAGIVGLPNVGKSTLFNCLTNAKAQSANFPFCTIEPNIGIVNVPDIRLETLESLVNPEKVVPATIEILDIAGLVKGASKGEGLGNQFLANIRETDAIIHVLRCFDNDKIIHVEGSIDPIRDKETIDMELQLKDLETIEKKIERIKRAIQTGEKNAIKENDILIKIQSSIGKSKNVRELNFTKEEYAQFVKPLQLLTDKPVLYVCNVDEISASKGNEYVYNAPDSYLWEIAGDGITTDDYSFVGNTASTNDFPIIDFYSSGDYVITNTVTGDCGLTDSTSFTLSLNEYPILK